MKKILTTLRNIHPGLVKVQKYKSTKSLSRTSFGIQKTLEKQGFTLVELIIVIAIIAVLAVAAFMMLTKWLGQSRDSRRLGDLKTLQTGLEVGYTDVDVGNGLYPDISGQDGAVLLYSGTDTSKLAYQGIVDQNVANQSSLQKVPLDPSDHNEYTYLVTANRKKFQLMAMLENGNEITTMINQTYALDYKNRVATVRGFDIGILLEADTNLPIQYGEKAGTGLNLSDDLIDYVAKAKDNEDLVVGTGIQALEIYTQETVSSIPGNNDELSGETTTYSCQGSLVVENADIKNATGLTENTDYQNTNSSGNCYYVCNDNYSGVDCDVYRAPIVITSQICSAAGWEWVDSSNDMYIGTTRGDGFCISPTIDLDSYKATSLNGRGYLSTDARYKGWTVNVDDTGNPNEVYGQTRSLSSPSGYSCASLGSATKGYTNSSNQDNISGQDSLENRMRYLKKYKQNASGMAYTNINWVNFGASPPETNYTIPAIFLSDCLDGTKDLGGDITYKHKDNTDHIITYTQYNADVSINTDNAALSNATYQNRQKYLLGRTQKNGSHLPSAYSYIDNNTAGGTTGNYKGEYILACEKSDGSVGTIAGTNDDTATERVRTASIGTKTGTNWGYTFRAFGYYGCSTETATATGNHGTARAARIVVRP